MDVFISWSGDRSQLLARSLADILPKIIQGLNAWMSDHGISVGSRWSQELNRQLDASNFGILCLTPENISAPWLLFEAGSLGKSISEAKVVPYRLGLAAADVPFPLAQFQGVDANEGGTRELVRSLNAGLEQPMEPRHLDRNFKRWWPRLEARINDIQAKDQGGDSIEGEYHTGDSRHYRITITHLSGDYYRIENPDWEGVGFVDGEFYYTVFRINDKADPSGRRGNWGAHRARFSPTDKSFEVFGTELKGEGHYNELKGVWIKKADVK